MIELNFLTPEPHVRYFKGQRIVIGAGSNDLSDLSLPEMEWEAEHLVFTQDAQGIWAINQANDPFVLLDNRPFSRRRLEKGHSYPFTLRGLSLLCRVLVSDETPGNPPVVEGAEDDLLALLQEVEQFPVTQSVAKKQDKSSLPKPLPSFSLPKQPLPNIPSTPTLPIISPTSTPLNASVFSAPQPGEPPVKLPEEKVLEKDRAASMAWKLVLASGATIFLLVAVFSLTVYGAFAETNTQAEFLVAQDVADVAMALVHARMHPDKQKIYNLADPDFLRGHLSELLGDAFPINLEMTPQGHLKNTAYLLRLYTNQDISQFVIVAQPEPSLWYWLIQPHTIFLDSTTMQLHKTQDVRMVNRILAQSNLFQSGQLAPLAPLFVKSRLIPLRTLGYELDRKEFTPPKELKKLRSGAENRVYNAPRYHRLGEPLFKMLTELKFFSAPDHAAFLENLHAFSSFQDMVIYTTESLQTAQKAIKALKTHVPDKHFLVAHMKLDHGNQNLIASHLVEQLPETSPLDLPEIADAEKHPLQIKFEELAQARKQAIEPLTQEMLAQITSHIQKPSENFYETMSDLLQRCKKVDGPSCEQLRHALAHFYLEYVIKEPRVAFTEFAAYTESAGLMAYLPTENMRALTSIETSDVNIDLSPWTNKIKEATTLHALDRSLLMADEWLLDQSISDPEQRLSYTLNLKKTAKLSLEQLLLNSKTSLALQERQRPILLHLVDTLLSVPPHEREIYLKEFERHLQKDKPIDLSQQTFQYE